MASYKITHILKTLSKNISNVYANDLSSIIKKYSSAQNTVCDNSKLMGSYIEFDAEKVLEIINGQSKEGDRFEYKIYSES